MSNSSIFVSITLDGIHHDEDVKYDIESPTSTTVADFVQRDVAPGVVQDQTFSWTGEASGRKVVGTETIDKLNRLDVHFALDGINSSNDTKPAFEGTKEDENNANDDNNGDGVSYGNLLEKEICERETPGIDYPRSFLYYMEARDRVDELAPTLDPEQTLATLKTIVLSHDSAYLQEKLAKVEDCCATIRKNKNLASTTAASTLDESIVARLAPEEESLCGDEKVLHSLDQYDRLLKCKENGTTPVAQKVDVRFPGSRSQEREGHQPAFHWLLKKIADSASSSSRGCNSSSHQGNSPVKRSVATERVVAGIKDKKLSRRGDFSVAKDGRFLYVLGPDSLPVMIAIKPLIRAGTSWKSIEAEACAQACCHMARHLSLAVDFLVCDIGYRFSSLHQSAPASPSRYGHSKCRP